MFNFPYNNNLKSSVLSTITKETNMNYFWSLALYKKCLILFEFLK